MAQADTIPRQHSAALFERMCRRMPGGNTRTATYFAPYPIALDRGEGAFIWDVDGNRFIDLVNNYTSLVHGHAHPAITESIVRETHRGTVFPSPILAQIELAERLCDRIDSVDQVRYTNSGTEAGMHAVRCARVATGRDLVVKADVGYHGSWDGAPSGRGDTRGVTAGVRDALRWVEFNAVDQLEAVMAAEGDQVAAILLEPMLGAGVVPGEQAFFEAARREADRHGALLILDEVVTLRLQFDGYQARFGVRPDLTTFGKLIGGGLPVGAFGGSADLMSCYDPRTERAVGHHGTFNGNALAMAAGAVSLDLLTAPEVDRINGLGARLAAGLRGLVADHGLDAQVTEDGSLVQLHAEVARIPRTGADLNPGSPLLSRLHGQALEAGVYIAPRGELNVTTAMDDGIVDEALERLDAAMGRL